MQNRNLSYIYTLRFLYKYVGCNLKNTMNLKGYKYNTDGISFEEQYFDCTLTIKNKNIVKIRIGDFIDVYPKEYHSESSTIIEFQKSHRPKTDLPKNCNYYIKYKHKDKLESIYLNINYFQHLQLKWEMKMFLIQSKEFIINLIFALLGTLLGYIIAPKC